MDKIKIECIVCKKEHFVSKSNKNTKCCSRGCANTYRASKITRPKCNFCNKIVNRRLSHCGKLVYCDKFCDIEAKKKRCQLICQICGITYERLESKKNSKYCSRKCMGVGIKKSYVKRKPQYRSYGECAIVCLLRKNYPNIKIETSNREQLNGYEIDIWLPELNVGIEYNGPHHFKPVYGESIFNKTIESDKKKMEIAIEKNIKLVYIIQLKSISKSSKTILYELFKKCCDDIGLPNPIVFKIDSNEIKKEQNDSKPSNNKFTNLGRKHSVQTKLKFSALRSKTHILKSPTGELITVNRLREFCEKQNIQYTWLLAQFKKGNPCKGWIKVS
jgi:hypothetical protein